MEEPDTSTKTGAIVVSISTSVPTQSRATSAQPHWPGAPQEELQLGRLEALLVNRSADTSWWDAMADQVDRLTNCFLPHLAEGAGEKDLRGQQFRAEVRVAPELARLEAEHGSLLDELAELRSVVEGSGRSSGSVGRALAASTEVIAMLRGHNRRHRNVAHDSGRADNGAIT